MKELNMVAKVQALFADYPNVSLRKLALTTETTYTLLLKASKKPIAGEAYDPDAVNYEEIAKFFNKREIALDELDWDALNNESVRATGNVVKDMSKFKVGMKVYLRKHPTTPYDIIYMTATHIVIMLEGTTEPQAWSHSTFLLNGPQFTPRAEKKELTEIEAE